MVRTRSLREMMPTMRPSNSTGARLMRHSSRMVATSEVGMSGRTQMTRAVMTSAARRLATVASAPAAASGAPRRSIQCSVLGLPSVAAPRRRSRSLMMPITSRSLSITGSAPTPFSRIRRAQSASGVWAVTQMGSRVMMSRAVVRRPGTFLT